MPTAAFKRETFFLTADVEAWLQLEAMLTALGDPEWEDFLRHLRYKLGRTGHMKWDEDSMCYTTPHGIHQGLQRQR